MKSKSNFTGLLAIFECVNTLASVEATNRNILIYSDDRAAINALAKTTTESNKITIAWVSGHQGIHGNEMAAWQN